ncbi:MAG TPA: DsbA family protein [Thermomicrobiales bacterium]|nr:DsbA family protein [Thermomicrobiales bacterium]
MAASASTKRKSRAQVRADADRARKRRLYLIGGAIAVALIVAAGLIWSNRDSSNLPGLHEADAAALAGIPTDGRVIGDPDAPVHLIEYGDYQCPACASFSQTVFPNLLSDYIATGKVSFEFRDLAFIGDDSVTAAEAAACSIDQDGYWLYHDTIYANHFGENLGNLSKSRLLQMAKLSGLDQDEISSCIDAGTNLTEVQSMHQEASQLGLTSTPSFVLNGEVLPWQGWDAMKQAIDAALASN